MTPSTLSNGGSLHQKQPPATIATARFSPSSGLEPAGSVLLLRSTAYWAGVSRRRHSSSLRVTSKVPARSAGGAAAQTFAPPNVAAAATAPPVANCRRLRTISVAPLRSTLFGSRLAVVQRRLTLSCGPETGRLDLRL